MKEINEDTFEDINLDLKPLSSFENVENNEEVLLDKDIEAEETSTNEEDLSINNTQEDLKEQLNGINEELSKQEEDIAIIDKELENKNPDKKHKHKKKKSKLKIFLITLITLFVIGVGSVLFLLYGPYSGFRNWLITTAMTTMNHQYFATWFYSDETIQKVLGENSIIESTEDSDMSLIKVGEINFNVGSYTNKYDKEILTKDNGNDDYKLINVSGKGYKGYLVAVYDPSKVSVITTKYLGRKGQYLVDMAKQSNASVAINGGGFIDPNYSSAGGSPHGVVIKNGQIITNNSYTATGGLIGFTKENKLILGKMSASEAISKGVRDAVTFGPFLIVNGKASFIKGNGGWGSAPRTAIGQRADGIVLFLVIDGRKLKYPGADMVDLTEIMQNYGAINAANLDGGTSSALVINNKLVNDPIDSSGSHETRMIPTGFALIK